jgi:hypothetical protein
MCAPPDLHSSPRAAFGETCTASARTPSCSTTGRSSPGRPGPHVHRRDDRARPNVGACPQRDARGRPRDGQQRNGRPLSRRHRRASRARFEPSPRATVAEAAGRESSPPSTGRSSSRSFHLAGSSSRKPTTRCAPERKAASATTLPWPPAPKTYSARRVVMRACDPGRRRASARGTPAS